ncbi:MAG TPA: J domain-containing protein [Planctomycetes bacterium]|nr:J domain-containing protein [Planctomycetota bacterium]
MLHCWACRSALTSKRAKRDGFLRGRSSESGGPYLVYSCPSCRKENRIEQLPDGNFYSSPAKEIGLVDWLFGWIEPLAPEDFLEIQSWHHKHSLERRAIFEGLGDQRYSGALWRRLLGRWIPRRRTDHRDPEIEQERSGTDRPSMSRNIPLPHPYRILGLPADADSEQIRSRFRELVKTHHPDKLHHSDPDQVEQASRKLQELIRAYEDLEKGGQV